MVLSTEWSQVEVIDLLNDGNGLGFILVGGKSTGVVIKALTPGGIAERDGRMQCGDHVLQIGEVNLRGFSSEQAATVLRQTGAQVRLIVARPVEPTSPDYQALASHAPIIPTKLLTDPEELERQLLQTAAISGPFFSAQDAMLQAAANAAAAAAQDSLNEEMLRLQQLQQQQQQLQHKPQSQTTLPTNQNNSQSRQQRIGSIAALSPGSLNVTQMYSPTGHGCCGHAADGVLSPCCDGDGDGFGTGYDSESSCGGACLERTSTSPSLPETETFDVVLHRNVYGLGIRVAGYVCEEEDLSGIFVKSMVEGGAGEAGRVRINDRILAVDGRSVAEATNHEAVTLLKNSGITVHLRIERFLRGRKYEHLQVALNDMKEVNIAATSTAGTATSKTAPTTAATTPAGGLGDNVATARRGTADGALALDMGRLMVNSETMQSISQLSLPPSPSCATLTWVAPKSDADSLATVDIDYPDVILDDKQIEAEFESHTTVDSHIFVVQYHANGSKTASCSSCSLSPTQESTPIPATQPPIVASTGAFSADSVNGTDLFPFSPPAHKTPASAGPTTSTASPTRATEAKPTVEQTAVNTNSTTSTTTSTTIHWTNEYPDSRIIVAQLHKLAGLGISLEGTVDVEGGIEKRPHHFIRSILGDGPVDLEGSLRPGDEILQVNEHRLQGLTHTEVVRIFKELPAQVRMVCARGPSAPSVINTSQNLEAFRSRSILAGGLGPSELATVPDVISLSGSCTAICGSSGTAGLGANYMTSGTLIKALSESSLFTASLAESSPLLLRQKPRSRSVEQVSGLALWSSDVVYVELLKTENGFGFSVLDYQDPLDVDGTVIVVRGLIPGGAAESSQQLFPGDRIISVGDVLVNGKTLDEAVEVLKGMPLGMVRIGLCRPLPVSDDSERTTPT